MSFRLGLLIGGLGVAVVALALVVVVLATGGGDGGESTTAATRENPVSAQAEVEPICRVAESGGDARLDLSESGLLCPEGQAIIGSIQRQIDAGLSGVLEAG